MTGRCAYSSGAAGVGGSGATVRDDSKRHAVLLRVLSRVGGRGYGPPAMPQPQGNLILKGSHYPQAIALRYAVNPLHPIYF